MTGNGPKLADRQGIEPYTQPPHCLSVTVLETAVRKSIYKIGGTNEDRTRRDLIDSQASPPGELNPVFVTLQNQSHRYQYGHR